MKCDFSRCQCEHEYTVSYLHAPTLHLCARHLTGLVKTKAFKKEVIIMPRNAALEATQERRKALRKESA